MSKGEVSVLTGNTYPYRNEIKSIGRRLGMLIHIPRSTSPDIPLATVCECFNEADAGPREHPVTTGRLVRAKRFNEQVKYAPAK